VELLLDRLAGDLQFVTIPELLQHGAPQYKKWDHTGDTEELNRFICQDRPARRYRTNA
jgi:hypothetical protein